MGVGPGIFLHMLSSKGIGDRAPDGRVRLTASAKDTLSRLVSAVLDRAYSEATHGAASASGTVAGDTISLARRVIVEHLRAHPADTSCATCDYEAEGQCMHWRQKIPATHVEKGCGQHKTEGAPF